MTSPTSTATALLAANPELAALAEQAEAEFMFQHVANVPEPSRSTLATATARIGGGVVLSMRNDPVGYYTQAIGFGFDEPVTDDLITRVLDFYRERGETSAMLQLASSVLPPGWDDICARHNIINGGSKLKLACRVEDFKPGATSLRVGLVDHANAAEWGSIVLQGFGWPDEGLSDMLAATVDNPKFYPVAVWDGDQIVAGANLLIHDGVGHLNTGSTLPSHRNRGAQSALLAIRAKTAAEAGCRWLVVETAKPRTPGSNPSTNNVLRAGFTEIDNRRAWVWQEPAT